MELGSLSPRLPPGGRWGPCLLFLSVAFYLCPKQGPWVSPVAPEALLEETPVMCAELFRHAWERAAHANSVLREERLAPRRQPKGWPSVRQPTACSLLRCRQLQGRKVVAPTALQEEGACRNQNLLVRRLLPRNMSQSQ